LWDHMKADKEGSGNCCGEEAVISSPRIKKKVGLRVATNLVGAELGKKGMMNGPSSRRCTNGRVEPFSPSKQRKAFGTRGKKEGEN